jgi:Ca-activated chloride channel homolog
MRKLCWLAYALTAFGQTAVFKSDTTLQSIAVQVTDKQGNSVKGLTAADFTLLEDGRPQNIAFFGAEKQPVSLAVLLDSSGSMTLGGKLERASSLLGPLLRGNRPEDQIFLVPFTDRLLPFAGLTPFTQLTVDQRLHPPQIKVSSTAGTAFYDALASALCHMRTAQNVRQAVVVITDGADQDSRLNLEQLIQLTRSSNAQLFMIGFFEKSEYEIFHESSKTVTLRGEREIDNPVVVFDRLAKESGAESFFPSSERGLQQALDRISAILDAEYTLAYYPRDASRFRKIEVKIKRGGVRVLSRRGAGSETDDNPVHFLASSCEVSAKDHLYPWESRATRSPSGALIYREDFSDPRSGWPNRREQIPTPRTRGDTTVRPGVRYIPGGYELSGTSVGNTIVTATGAVADGVIAAQGAFWDDFRASVLIEANLGAVGETAPGLVFHLGTTGYYALVLSGGPPTHRAQWEPPIRRAISFKLVKKTFSPDSEAVIVPWTEITLFNNSEVEKKQRNLSVQYSHGRIEIQVDDLKAAKVEDTTYPNGLIGLALFGHGRAVFHDLVVEELR